MNIHRDSQFAVTRDRGQFRRGSLQVLAFLAGMLLLAGAAPLKAQSDHSSAAAKSSDKNYSAGFTIGQSASAKDVGLPWYPGARLHKDKSDDSPSVQLGLWGGSSAFKLVVLKLESSDAPGKVQAFYRDALARYGHVVTCSGSSSATSEKNQGKSDENKSSDQLDCESDKPESNETVLKAGAKHNQHIVGITASGSGSIFQLVYVQTPKSDD
jgi:hypothetical protein